MSAEKSGVHGLHELSLLLPVPHARAHGVYHALERQFPGGRHNGFPDRDSTLLSDNLVTLLIQFRAGRVRDLSGNATATRQATVCRIHNSIRGLCQKIGYRCLENPPLTEFHPGHQKTWHSSLLFTSPLK